MQKSVKTQCWMANACLTCMYSVCMHQQLTASNTTCDNHFQSSDTTDAAHTLIPEASSDLLCAVVCEGMSLWAKRGTTPCTSGTKASRQSTSRTPRASETQSHGGPCTSTPSASRLPWRSLMCLRPLLSPGPRSALLGVSCISHACRSPAAPLVHGVIVLLCLVIVNCVHKGGQYFPLQLCCAAGHILCVAVKLPSALLSAAVYVCESVCIIQCGGSYSCIAG